MCLRGGGGAVEHPRDLRDDAADPAAWTLVEATAKLLRATGRVAHNCEAIARDLSN